jgi:murein DD-endopeptidase MepM/ murein hydrolase activator NlpD
MIDVYTVQRIARRKTGSRHFPAGKIFYDSRTEKNIIDQIEQHPLRKRYSPGKSLQRGPAFRPAFSGPRLSRFLTPLLSAFRRGRRIGALGALFPAREAGETSERTSVETPAAAAEKNDTYAGAAIRHILPVEQWRYMIPLAATALLFCLSLALNRRPADVFIMPREDSFFQENLASYAGLTSLPAPSVGENTMPLDLTETFEWRSYTVQKGDSVSKIAVNNGISMDAIIASNGITNAKRLAEGQVIRIPNMDGIPYTVLQGDSLAKISAAQDVPLEAILDANDIRTDTITAGTVLFIPGARMRKEDLKLALGEFFIYPIRGRLSSPYGWRNDPISGVRRYHAALDLAAATGTPIKAAMDGTVSTVGINSVYGKYIIISHGSGFQTLYAHLSVVSVAQGSRISQGLKIGEVGSTGYSTGPHLHFAVFKNGRAVNPLDFLHS